MFSLHQSPRAHLSAPCLLNFRSPSLTVNPPAHPCAWIWEFSISSEVPTGITPDFPVFALILPLGIFWGIFGFFGNIYLIWCKCDWVKIYDADEDDGGASTFPIIKHFPALPCAPYFWQHSLPRLWETAHVDQQKENFERKPIGWFPIKWFERQALLASKIIPTGHQRSYAAGWNITS